MRATTRALNNLAPIYQEVGKYDEAIKTFEESRELKRRCDDGNLVEMATTLINLGHCYRDSGNLEKSLNFMEEAVTISRSCYSSAHPLLARAISQLSSTYDLLDRNDEAWKLAREALDIANVSLRSSNPELAAYMNQVGHCCLSREDPNEAIEWYEKSHQLLQQLPSSPTRDDLFSATLINLGGCYRESGKLEKSLSSMKEGVAISRSCNSFPHSSLALAIYKLSSTYYLLDRKDEAWKLAREALDIANASLPSSHPQLAKYMNQVGCCCLSRGDSNEAIVWYEKSHQLLQQLPSSPMRNDLFATTLDNLAIAYQIDEKYDKAIKTYEESLELNRRCDDGNLAQMSTILINLGSCYRESGKLEKSLTLREEAVKISRSCYSSSHPSLALAIYHLSSTYYLLDRKDEAWKLAREALDIANVSSPSSHPQLAEYMNHLGDCCRSQGNYNEAISWYDKARQLLQQQDQSPERDKGIATS
ncbi:nephrocystin-3-like [Corticium candelabrum]|uniref:nephrocystin-3-like n=1 Tax=Corticium candelabrum TaxID=121492 RepID=UPI002E26F2A2|nr:nephrocystin-3-like [Corticium candelabrum]